MGLLVLTHILTSKESFRPSGEVCLRLLPPPPPPLRAGVSSRLLRSPSCRTWVQKQGQMPLKPLHF